MHAACTQNIVALLSEHRKALTISHPRYPRQPAYKRAESFLAAFQDGRGSSCERLRAVASSCTYSPFGASSSTRIEYPATGAEAPRSQSMKLFHNAHAFAAALSLSLPVALFVVGVSCANPEQNMSGVSAQGGSDAGYDLGQVGEAPTTCGGESQPARLVPLDLFIMLDASSSMDYQLENSPITKWKAVTQALVDFVEKASMEELSIGLQVFPHIRTQVPKTCMTNPSCGSFGPCRIPHICDNLHQEGGVDRQCTIADDCIEGSSVGECVPQGYCGGNPNRLCIPGYEGVCKGDFSECNEAPGACAGRQSCSVADYATPTVPLTPHADAFQPMKEAIEAIGTEGATPTGAALQGAVNYMNARLAQYPDNRAVVLLVTDGLPTDCEPVDISGIADIAASAAPKVTTYVIGVFEDEIAAEAQKNLNAIAAAGQTSTAFVLKTSGDVGAELTNTLASIRSHYISCEYPIPVPTEGQFRPDFVNIEHVEGESVETIGRVDNLEKCGNGGWYYERDEYTIPTRIHLCPETCADVQGNPDARVDVRLGCATVIQ